MNSKIDQEEPWTGQPAAWVWDQKIMILAIPPFWNGRPVGKGKAHTSLLPGFTLQKLDLPGSWTTVNPLMILLMIPTLAMENW